jgi:alcohol dehydrogenase class IV
VAAALGVHCRVPHGLACAVMLPAALRVNRPLREAEFSRLASAFGVAGASESSRADAVVEKVQALCDAVGVPRRLSTLGVQREQLPDLVRSSRGNSMSGNPRELSDGELHRLLEEML